MHHDDVLFCIFQQESHLESCLISEKTFKSIQSTLLKINSDKVGIAYNSTLHSSIYDRRFKTMYLLFLPPPFFTLIGHGKKVCTKLS